MGYNGMEKNRRLDKTEGEGVRRRERGRNGGEKGKYR